MTNHDRLAAMIAKGKWHFILYRGVLGRGVLTGTLFAVWMYLTKPEFRAAGTVWPLIAFPIVGVLWGARMWSVAKKSFDESRSS